MRLLAVSIVPIYKDHVEGGAQRVLVDVLKELSKRHEVRLLCTAREDNHREFCFSRNFRVSPTLKFRPYWPFPYMTNPRHIKDIISAICREAEWADRIFINSDGIFFKNFLRRIKKPLVASLHDFLYPMSITSALLPDSDKIIVTSEYVRECIRHSVGQLYKGYMNRVVAIDCGVDSRVFFRDEEQRRAMRSAWGIGPHEFCLLFPHRPEESKGIPESIELLARLRKKRIPAKLLFLRHADFRRRPELRETYRGIEARLRARGLGKCAVFRDWMPLEKMRLAYSAADVTLNLGNFVESFGLAPIESALCETPVIASKVGCLRRNLRELPGLFTHDYGDIGAAVRACERILAGKPAMGRTRVSLGARFSLERMVGTYETELESAVVRPVPKIDRSAFYGDGGGLYRLAPWCCFSKKGIYDDYLGRHFRISVQQRKTLLHPSGVFQKIAWMRDLEYHNCIVPAN